MKFATAVLVISLTTLFAREANATKKSKVCGMRNWPSCALQQVDIVTSNYSISVERASSADDEEVSFSRKFCSSHGCFAAAIQRACAALILRGCCCNRYISTLTMLYLHNVFTFRSTVRVYRTECLRYHHMSHSLNWYRLEALLVEANTTTRIGKFVEPFESHRLETYGCQGDSVSSMYTTHYIECAVVNVLLPLVHCS